MKKWTLLVVVVAMVGWAVFDFIDAKKEKNVIEQAQQFENTEQLKQEEGNEYDDTTVNLDMVTEGLEIDDLAPDFELRTLSGETVKLSDYRGKRVMVNFWATWCPPCRAEMPDMEKLSKEEDVVVLAVNLTDTETSEADVEKFIDKYKFTFPILLDDKLNVASLYEIQPIPTTYMIDPNGLIGFKAYGAMNYDLMLQAAQKMN